MRDMFEMITNKFVVGFLISVFALTLTFRNEEPTEYYVYDDHNDSNIVYKK